MYKGHPLRRKDNLIYYGSMADKYIIMLQILETKKVKDMDVASKVSVQLQLTDPDIKSRDRVVRKTEKDGLSTAMDFASVRAPSEDIWMAYSASLPIGTHTEHPDGRRPQTVFFCDYASAGNTWTRANFYRTWFPVEYGNND